ncbi:MAG: TIGR01212 family radical SAM protein [Bacteroidales bacterium]|nr:TIGR01212 family radical SAM protein [Bacteroidales bacterium]
MEYPWGHQRRFNAYSNYFIKTFGQRVQKVSINAGFTCPNRDGLVSSGGCTFCNNQSFNPSYCDPKKSVTQQIEEGIEFHRVRYRRATKYLAYFQAFSNTYAPLEKLKEIYQPALDHKDVVGIVVGTRPDCIDDEKLDFFAQIAKEKYLIIEYGVESCNDASLKAINRGHNYQTSVDAIQKTHDRGIKTGAHFIFGLPGESKEEMMAMAPIISKLPIDNIKFHQLQIITDTKMGEEYLANPEKFTFFEPEEYVDFFIDFAEQLNPNFVIERFVNEVPARFNLQENWKMRNDQLLNLFEKRLEERDTWQGRLYKEE